MLTLSNVTKTHAGNIVLADVSLAVPPQARIGVVGPNGIGKSTLLRTMARLDEPDSGTVGWTPPSLRVGYLPQERHARDAETVHEYVARRTGVAAAETELDRLTAALGRDSSLGEAYDEALQRFLALGGDDLTARSRAVLRETGLGAHALERPLAELSGGERARVSLAALLLARFDVLLLDEPTNDLDFEGLARLERFVEDFGGAMVVISHDREFLDRTVSRIVELEEGSHRAREYAGGWSEYEAERERARSAQYRRFNEVDERRRGLESLLRARRGQAAAGRGGESRRATNARRSKVRQAARAIERLDAVEKPFEPWELRLELEPDGRSAEVVARLEGAVVELDAFTLGPVDLELRWGERLALAGPNGSGKTTLVRALLGQLPLAAGSRRLGPGVIVGSLDQGRAGLRGPESVLSAFRHVPVPVARSLLAKFGLGAEDVDRPARSLSPGERTRAGLALLVAERVNCLVLDEPTNHLDLPAIEQLEAALSGFPGTVVLVTHDRRLLESFEPSRTLALGPPE